MNALRKRIDAGENEQKKQRALELERLLQRYQNVKKVGVQVLLNRAQELENQQKLERNRFEKAGKKGLMQKNTMNSTLSVQGSPQKRGTLRGPKKV